MMDEVKPDQVEHHPQTLLCQGQCTRSLIETGQVDLFRIANSNDASL
jgi:hypothetical protein